jgi:hypothetical protein
MFDMSADRARGRVGLQRRDELCPNPRRFGIAPGLRADDHDAFAVE